MHTETRRQLQKSTALVLAADAKTAAIQRRLRSRLRRRPAATSGLFSSSSEILAVALETVASATGVDPPDERCSAQAIRTWLLQAILQQTEQAVSDGLASATSHRRISMDCCVDVMRCVQQLNNLL